MAHRVFEEGSYADDDVMVEYLAGILAAARTPDGRDDRGAYFANIVAGLSANQVRLHHAVCAAIVSAELKADESFGAGQTLPRYAVYVPLKQANKVLSVAPDEAEVSSRNLLGETVVGLDREGLLSGYAVTDAKSLGYDGFDGPILMAVPTILALHLFLWAYGIRDGETDDLQRCLDDPFVPPGPRFDEFELGPAQ